ncbi:hypothetical protein EB796_017456 [Bugula neritina]|uniref:Uncharacterized protein n=1 Tax=Bugula neritina TaxID=10212 RepID=A0A7J7JDR1_BUGNE|nr:hypothetical protein EB796_017456 [Bugula neritina]
MERYYKEAAAIFEPMTITAYYVPVKLEPEMRFRYMTVGAVNLVKISDVLNSRPLPHTPRSHNRALHTRRWKKCQTRRYHTPHL